MISCSLAVLASPKVVRAQREMFTNTNAWFVVNADVALDGHWGILFDASARRSGTTREAMASFVRGGLAYEFSPHVRVAAGANWSRTYPYGELPSAYPVTERRVWQQALLSHDVGAFAFSHRYRLEQRWRGRRDDPDVDRIDRWERSSRFRYQVRATLPLTSATYVSAANEFFLAFGGNVKYNVFDQDRASAVVGLRMTRAWRVEAGFLEQLLLKPTGVQWERNHTFTFALSYTRVAPSPAAGGLPAP